MAEEDKHLVWHVMVDGKSYYIPKDYVLVKKPELLEVGLPSRHTEGEGVPVQEPERP